MRWARPCVETLEARLSPALNGLSAFIVPVSQPENTSHFHRIIEALTQSAESITIEPGASPEASDVMVTQGFVTIQGDPNVPSDILPRYNLVLLSDHIQLHGLQLDRLRIGAGQGDTHVFANRVTNCAIVRLDEFGSESTFSQNTIMAAVLDGTNDVVSNNIFRASSGPLLEIDGGVGTIVVQNTFESAGSTRITAIAATPRMNGQQTAFVNNSITVPHGLGMFLNQLDNVDVRFNLFNNTINTGDDGTGVSMAAADNGLSAVLEGNDFHHNAIGLSMRGNAHGDIGTIDLGGGSLLSRGGNNFRGFFAPANSAHAAIVLDSAAHVHIPAQLSIFGTGVVPLSVVVPNGENVIDVTQPLSPERAFVQTVYNEVLGRTGSLVELDPWVSLLGGQGQAAVANGILHSAEALGRVVDQLYLRFLGRQSDATGRSGWIGFLQQGGTLEQVETLFLTSPEYIGHIDTIFVQSLYLNILGRPGSGDELTLWNNQIQSLGFADITSAFVRSPENRVNTLRLDFQAFLHRTPPVSELIPLVNTSRDLLGLEGMVLSSLEFFANG
jgi:hypothetical protein